jgi:beta-lactamase regulating signal transducer with metallopeptidase domain
MSSVIVESLVGSAAALFVSGWLLKATIVLGFAWVLAKLCARASAAVHHGIWAVAIAGTLLTPMASTWLPPLTIEVPWTADVPVRAGPLTPEVLTALPSSIHDEEKAVGIAPPLHSLEPDPMGRAGGGAAPADRPAVSWMSILVLIWAVGVLLRTSWLALQLGRLRWFSAEARAITQERALRLLEHGAAELGLRRCVRLVESSRSAMPVTWGVIRPAILLPVEAREWPEEQVRIAILHELAHVRRWDYLTCLLAEFAAALYWPHPLVWVARRRLFNAQEQACDDLVLTAGTRPVEYAEHLLQVARAFNRERTQMAVGVALAREVSLKTRVRSILDGHANRRPLNTRSGVAVLLLLAGALVVVASVRPTVGTAEPRVKDTVGAPESTGSPVTDTGGAVPSADVPPVGWVTAEADSPEAADAMPARATYYWVEAAHARRDGSLRLIPDDGAAGDDAVTFRGSSGIATYVLDVESPGRYVVWGRVLAPDGNSNSLHFSLNGDEEIVWDAPGRPLGSWAGYWTWSAVSGRDERGRPGPALLFDLESGRHEIRLRTRESGLQLAGLLVTNDLDYRPNGIWPGELPSQPVLRRLEAETAALTEPFRIGEDPSAGGGRYVLVPAGDPTRRSPGTEGVAMFRVDVPVAGTYTIWARTIAPSTDEDSFWVRVNGERWVMWNGIPLSTSWRWAPVNDREIGRELRRFGLRAGENVIEFAPRESGVRLDQILVTNDPIYRPAGPTGEAAR